MLHFNTELGQKTLAIIININDITIQQEELSEVRWFTMDELKGMVNSGELNEDQIACFNKVCNYLNNN